MTADSDETLLTTALRAARDTKFLAVGGAARFDAPAAFAAQFDGADAVVVADRRTFAAAGRDVLDAFRRAGKTDRDPILMGDDVYAGIEDADSLQAALAATPGGTIPVAVGSGTINDLAKLASHRLGRPYMAVATAASMDGYTAYGASITAKGSKQTFDCPAPRAVLADLDVIAQAPRGMNASGYADLLAKNVAGADWILADALGEEAIDGPAWGMVQPGLRRWVANPADVDRGQPEALRNLVRGLMMTGFAMQAALTSRPASGAEHQFSHLWDMQHHTFHGSTPSHGFKVGIGTLASLALYEDLLGRDTPVDDPDRVVAAWPTLDAVHERIDAVFGPGDLADKAHEEMRVKHSGRDTLRDQIGRVVAVWPEIRDRLRTHLIPFAEARDLLHAAGCPTTPEAIGITRGRLRDSYEQAYFIRRRFTGLDFAARLGLLPGAMGRLFGPGGRWATAEQGGQS